MESLKAEEAEQVEQMVEFLKEESYVAAVKTEKKLTFSQGASAKERALITE